MNIRDYFDKNNIKVWTDKNGRNLDILSLYYGESPYPILTTDSDDKKPPQTLYRYSKDGVHEPSVYRRGYDLTPPSIKVSWVLEGGNPPLRIFSTYEEAVEAKRETPSKLYRVILEEEV